MNSESLRQLLEELRDGRLSVEDGLQRLRHLPFEDLGFAKLDHHRDLRCGFPEVIYCAGKTCGQVVEIFGRHIVSGAAILATRADRTVYDAVRAAHPDAEYHEPARCVTLRCRPAPTTEPRIVLVSAGTADLPVAEEARVTAEIMDQPVAICYDAGVAGIHRLLASAEQLQKATVVIVVAGMEGALASVVGGLVAVPVIAVPTSVGYGASFGGLAALLAMLNSCSNNVAVVNIDNGFGAGYLAALICRTAAAPKERS